VSCSFAPKLASTPAPIGLTPNPSPRGEGRGMPYLDWVVGPISFVETFVVALFALLKPWLLPLFALSRHSLLPLFALL